MVAWGNIYFAAGLLEIGNGANKALKSPRRYGKFKNKKGKWIYWTKIGIENLPPRHKEVFESFIEKNKK